METEKTPVDLSLVLKVGKELFEQLGVVDSKNGPLLPSMLRRRLASGAMEEVPIMLMTLDEPRRYKARTKSRTWAIDQKLDLERDKDLVDQLESYEMLAYAIREFEAPHDQKYAKGEELFAAYKKGPLMEIWGIFNHWDDLNNPRFGSLSREEMWNTIFEIVKDGTLRPLMRIAGLEQSSCMLLMARAALSSPMAPSSLRLPWTSQSPSDSTSTEAADSAS